MKRHRILYPIFSFRQNWKLLINSIFRTDNLTLKWRFKIKPFKANYSTSCTVYSVYIGIVPLTSFLLHCPKGNRFSAIYVTWNVTVKTKYILCKIFNVLYYLVSSTFHVISRKIGLLFGQCTDGRAAHVSLPLTVRVLSIEDMWLACRSSLLLHSPDIKIESGWIAGCLLSKAL